MKDIYKNLNDIETEEEVEKTVDIPVTLPPIIVKVPAPIIEKVEVTTTQEPRVYPDVQKVEIVKEPQKDIQKVEVTNPQEPAKITFPDIQKVEVTNPTTVHIPDIQKVVVTNPTPSDIPIGKADIPGEADPERYVPVRLTDGKKFYSGLSASFASAAKSSFPYVDVNGKPKQVQLDGNGNLPVAATFNPPALQQVQVIPGVTTAVSGSLSLTTTSGNPMNSAITNFPTIQTVNVQNMPEITANIDVKGVTLAVSGTITTVSGSKTDIQNFPTVQTVNVQNLPPLTTVSGSIVDIKNFPTIQKVSIQDMPTITAQLAADGVTTAISGNVTTLSGSQVDVKNFPTVQTVSVQNLPGVTTVSGSSTNIANFPTYQTVNVANIPTIVTTAVSGTHHEVIDNFPTVQTVITQGITTISGQAGVTIAVSGTVTTVSGFHTTIDNFPTFHTVNVQNMPSITGSVTTLSGSFVDIKNFPTVQSVREQNPITTITTVSGSSTNVANFPTYQTVNIQNIPNITTASGSAMDIKNFPTYQGVRLFDAGGNYIGVPTNPITISGTNTGWNSTTVSGQAAAGGAASVKASGGVFGGYYIYNPNSSVTYLQVFNQTSVNLGTTNPDMTFGIPATSAANLIFPLQSGRQMGRGIMIAATTTAKGNTPPTTGIDATIFYN